MTRLSTPEIEFVVGDQVRFLLPGGSGSYANNTGVISVITSTEIAVDWHEGTWMKKHSYDGSFFLKKYYELVSTAPPVNEPDESIYNDLI